MLLKILLDNQTTIHKDKLLINLLLTVDKVDSSIINKLKITLVSQLEPTVILDQDKAQKEWTDTRFSKCKIKLIEIIKPRCPWSVKKHTEK